MRNVSLLGWSGLPECFALCPPRFALLLYLRKALRQTAPGQRVSVRLSQIPSFAAMGTVCLLQRSKGGACAAGGGHERRQIHRARCELSIKAD